MVNPAVIAEMRDPFCSCDLNIDPVTFIYELDPYSLEIYRLGGVGR